MLFLQELTLQPDEATIAAITAIGLVLLAFIALLALGLYIYSSFAFMAIAKKAKLNSPGLAWIPLVGPAIIAFQSSKMDWWPWLLLIGVFIPFLSGLFFLAFAVFVIIWNWKMFEKVGRPGWWAIFMLIYPVYLVFIGITAWSK